MSKLYLYALLGMLLCACSGKPNYRTAPINEVEIINVIEDSSLSVRALEIGADYLYYGSRDHLGRIALNKELKFNLEDMRLTSNLNHFKNIMTYEDRPLEFRAIAEVNGDLFGISVGNPARLYCLPRKAKQPILVYDEAHETVFYDSMAFWNDKEGIAIGDPTEGCMSIIITRDAGQTWTKISCELLPVALEGEAAFAASDTNIAIAGDKAWIATGGRSSRILYSSDKGKSWSVKDIPVVQGEPTTGLYSIDFYNEYIGFGIGGDYTRPKDSIANKLLTTDGGNSWTVVADGESPGYRSCVQFIPHMKGEELVAVGFKGIDYSSDKGRTWQHLSDEGFYTVRFVNDSVAYAGGRGRISKLLFR
jgi:photosystem II stability/assembly factor-like uncharacterized protein